MRWSARPFITEYKSRSSKSSASASPSVDAANKPDPIPSFLQRGAVVMPRINAEDAYRAALKAADAVFGGGNAATLLREEASSLNVHVSRALPSLIADDDALTVRAGKDGEKARRGSKLSTVKGPSTAGQEKQPLPRKNAEPDVVAEPAEKVPASHRERSSIQKRWVLGTELKSGQKWKRRLCKAAR